MKIALLCGGTSSEREVSLRSGAAIMRGLQNAGHAVEFFDVPERFVIENASTLARFDMAFLGFHGGAGEDGRIQAALDLAQVPYTGSGFAASALAMDKIHSKCFFDRAKVPTATWLEILDRWDENEILMRFAASGIGYPAVVKPACEGSTVGIAIAENRTQLLEGIANAKKFGKVLVEKYIDGHELTVSILGKRALPLVEICPENGFYDYEHKYTKGKSQYLCPAPIPQTIAELISNYALAAFEALGCHGYARIDFRYSDVGEIACLEANTLPGMTDLSLVPMAAAQVGIDFTQLVDTIARMAVEK